MPDRAFCRCGLVLVALLTALCGACVNIPATTQEVRRLEGIPGPEDLLLDRSVSPPRLIVSSEDRRFKSKAGELYAVRIPELEAAALRRTGEPADLELHPHGMDTVRLADGTWLLYVINHPAPGKDGEDAVLVYELFRDRLEFRERLVSPLLTSPNDLAATADGSVYVTNFGSGGGIGELLLRRRKSTVVYHDASSGSWSVAASGLAMANGIAIGPERVYVVVTRGDAVYSFSREKNGALADRRLLAPVVGGDNLFLDGPTLYVAAHVKSLAFMRHAGNGRVRSPSVIYAVEIGSGASSVVFSDAGGTISAASGAVAYGGWLYIGQVFGDYVLAAMAPR